MAVFYLDFSKSFHKISFGRLVKKIWDQRESGKSEYPRVKEVDGNIHHIEKVPECDL